MLEQKIADKNLLRIIGRFLKAGVMEEGKLRATEKGAPQGQVSGKVTLNANQ